jgi:ribonucleotide monophosphatase NagD (HAD superfamily)
VCAGLLATFYENQGGTVRYHGKPFPGVYATCLAHLDGIERARVLAIGDGLKTDIKGANGAGIDSVLITSGVHGEALKLESDGWFDEAALSHLMTQEQAQPTYVLHRLQ